MKNHKRVGLYLDWPLVYCLLGLLFFACIILYSARSGDIVTIQRQVVRLLISGAVCVLAAQIHPRYYKDWAPGIYTVGLLLLFCVLLFGDSSKGAQRWLDFGLFRFQPSELMKLAVPLMVATYLDSQLLPPKPKHILVCLLLILLPSLLVIRQPDLGTGLLIMSSGFFVLFLSGISWRLIFSAISLVVVCLPATWMFLRDYQRERILTFLSPERDPLGSGYHIIQSKIAIGAGGVFGKGWMEGTQSQLNFLPERSTDFIFAVLSEEFGLFGVLILFFLYALLIIRGLYIAYLAEGTFNQLITGNIVLTFFLYVFVNVGMVSGLLPVVGVPLPLISYGGTALITLMIGWGMVISIHTHKRSNH